MAAFKPTGDRARWRELYDHASKLAPGDIITYNTLTELLTYDPSKPGASRAPIYRANDELLVKRSRMLVAVPGEGYRIAHATEHEVKARGLQKSARRRIGKAVCTAVHVDRNQLTEAQQKSIDTLTDVLLTQNAMLTRHDKRIGNVEETVSRVDDRIGAMEDALRAHGIDVPSRRVVDGEVADE